MIVFFSIKAQVERNKKNEMLNEDRSTLTADVGFNPLKVNSTFYSIHLFLIN